MSCKVEIIERKYPIVQLGARNQVLRICLAIFCMKQMVLSIRLL